MRRSGWCSLAMVGALSASAGAQTLSGLSLTRALQRGGYVIVMRHASSPQAPPDSQEAAPGNLKPERQLDQAGIDSAKKMGESLRKLNIPIGTVYSSPALRAVETVVYLQLGSVTAVPELGDHGVSMSGVDPAQTDWLRAAVRRFEPGKNVFIVTHMPNITAAFPNDAADLKDGEALVFGPEGNGGERFVTRIRIEEWAALPD